MPVAFTDPLNIALDNLATTLNQITGLQIVTDPRNLVPPCAFIDAASFTVFANNVLEITFPVRMITLGPGNLDAQRSLLNLASKVVAKKIGVTDGRPTIAIIGGSELPAYDLTISLQAKA
ncbi:hypothetical protein UFOVP1267_6 [uncultured Caudovirales phage]|uniref:Uncharacterized protein n=1 Tax=uncultured Caudovirales phage TaxID=2100421 RepID=A0A6J5RS52_9CAUD|nr:hypothetical protein UFOVP1267_6 [uncultured Caudovirales phage]